METLNKKRLGDILVSSGKITYEQLNEALISQKILGKKLGDILLDSNIITEKEYNLSLIASKYLPSLV